MNPRLALAGIAILVVTVSIGTWLDARATPTPMPRASASGDFVLAGDFHVHAFPGDGALPGWELRRDARRLGLDVIVVSNHNQVLAAQLGASVASADWPLLLPAQEVTTPLFHMVAVGVRERVDWTLPPVELIAAIHRQGGVAIAAHPTPPSWASDDDRVLAAIDGAEVAHPLTEFSRKGRQLLDAFFARARAVNPTLAPIGSSDFHAAGSPGYCRTHLLARALTAGAVLDAIREGRTVAEDPRGRLYGAPDHVAIVQAHLASRERPGPRPLVERFTALGALAGALLLVLATTPRRVELVNT
jgi:hypothetical protein